MKQSLVQIPRAAVVIRSTALPKVIQEWSFETFMDFGVIGEKQVDVYYDHFHGRPTLDRLEPPEPEHCVVNAVHLDGKDIKDSLQESLIEDLEIEALERWRG